MVLTQKYNKQLDFQPDSLIIYHIPDKAKLEHFVRFNFNFNYSSS